MKSLGASSIFSKVEASKPAEHLSISDKFNQYWEMITTDSVSIGESFKRNSHSIVKSSVDGFNLCECLLQKLQMKTDLSRDQIFDLNYFFYSTYDNKDGAFDDNEKVKEIINHLYETIDDTYKLMEVDFLKDLTLGQDKFKYSSGTFYEYEFNRFFKGFTKERYSKYSDREELLKSVSSKTGNELHRVTSISGEPFKIHFFGNTIEVSEYEYVVRSGLLFDPTLMPEGKTESVLVDEYLRVLSKLNNGIELEFKKWGLSEWVTVII